MKRKSAIARYGVILLIMLSLLCQEAAAYTVHDTQSPTAPEGLTAASVTHTTISLSWTSSYDNISVKGYEIYRDGRKITTTSKTTYTSKDLVPGMKYAYVIKAYDAAGNVSEDSTVLNAATISDLESPSTPKYLKASSVSHTSATLTWEPSTDNVGIKCYEVYCSGKRIASPATTSYECKNLAPGITYTFCVKALDKAGNYSSESDYASATTLSDKTAPSSPRELKATSVSLTEVNLIWQPASDNVKVRGYDILRNGIKIGSTTKTSYCNRGLTPGKSYTYTVRASDISGNLSSSSSQLNVVTSEDTQAPTAPSGLKVTAVKGSSVSLSWTASADDSKVAGYQIYCNGIVIATAARTSRIVRSPFDLGSDVFWIKAYDQACNLSDSSNTVTVDKPSE